MNWKLVLLLSMFGLAMAITTAFVHLPNVEPILWVAIFVVCAVVIARRAPGRFFLHGFCVGFTNWMWVTAAHVILFAPYMASHAHDLTLRAMSLSPPRWPLIASIARPILEFIQHYDAPIPGASGVVIGLCAWVASRVIRGAN
jgi:hypothetical protein